MIDCFENLTVSLLSGGMSLELARRFPNLRFVVQDREVVIRKAEQVWLQELPVALRTERVKLMAHDFFTEQPVKSAAAFLMRHILSVSSASFSLLCTLKVSVTNVVMIGLMKHA